MIIVPGVEINLTVSIVCRRCKTTTASYVPPGRYPVSADSLIRLATIHFRGLGWVELRMRPEPPHHIAHFTGFACPACWTDRVRHPAEGPT